MSVKSAVKKYALYFVLGAFAVGFVLFTVFYEPGRERPAPPDRRRGGPKPTYVIPIGDVPESDVEFVRALVEASLCREAVVAPTLPLREEYYGPDRRQYIAPALLKYLEANAPDDAYLAVGITAEDIFAKNRNFLIGIARCPGRAAVLSSCRMSAGGVDDRARSARLAKLLVHETGHTFGLRHCRQPLCAMAYANSVGALDGQRLAYCERCEKVFSAAAGLVAGERVEKVAAVVELYGLSEALGGPDGLTPPPAPENLEPFELDY